MLIQEKCEINISIVTSFNTHAINLSIADCLTKWVGIKPSEYLAIVKVCLGDLAKLHASIHTSDSFERYMDSSLFVLASHIGENSQGMISGRTFQYRKETIHEGKKLYQLFNLIVLKLRFFEKTLVKNKETTSAVYQLIVPYLDTFIQDWESFQSRVEADKKDAYNAIHKRSTGIANAYSIYRSKITQK